MNHVVHFSYLTEERISMRNLDLLCYKPEPFEVEYQHWRCACDRCASCGFGFFLAGRASRINLFLFVEQLEAVEDVNFLRQINLNLVY